MISKEKLIEWLEERLEIAKIYEDDDAVFIYTNILDAIKDGEFEEENKSCNKCKNWESRNENVKWYDLHYSDKMMGREFDYCPDCGRKLRIEK